MRKREVREMPRGKFATQKAGGPLCSKREVRHARSGRFAMREAKGSLCEKREIRKMSCGRFATQKAEGPLCEEREIRAKSSKNVASRCVNDPYARFRTIDLSLPFPHLGFYEIKEASASRNHVKSRMRVTILCGSGSKARFSANEQAHAPPPALRSPELVQRIPRHSLSTPERSSRRNLLRRAKASSILLRERNPKQPAIWRAAFSSKASSKSCRLVNAKFGIPRSWNAFARKASWCRLRSPS